MSRRWILFLSFVAVLFGTLPAARASSARRTPIVEAIARARPAVVDLRSEKRAPFDTFGDPRGGRSVNGMGTGIILDERGYIVTNQHVIDGVSSLSATIYDGTVYPAHIVSSDPRTDLALIKIEPTSPLPVIPMGSSSDLMVGETVIAVGNAYGYEHTVTLGIISALGRHVEVSDELAYENLIQTDASINPGNSGGPLMNIDGELIGINVAIRSGAQGIGFAIPIDDARRVIADLMSVRRLKQISHGIVARELRKNHQPVGVVVERIEASAEGRMEAAGLEAEATNQTGAREQEIPVSHSATRPIADPPGLQPGDVIVEAANRRVANRVDLERALLDHKAGEAIEFVVQRGDEKTRVQWTLRSVAADQPEDRAWRMLGLGLEPVAPYEVQQYDPKYRGGLRVTAVRPNSPAQRRGIRPGDILVGLHVWETIKQSNVTYVLARPELSQISPLKFYVLRGGQTLYGHLEIAP